MWTGCVIWMRDCHKTNREVLEAYSANGDGMASRERLYRLPPSPAPLATIVASICSASEKQQKACSLLSLQTTPLQPTKKSIKKWTQKRLGFHCAFSERVATGIGGGTGLEGLRASRMKAREIYFMVYLSGTALRCGD